MPRLSPRSVVTIPAAMLIAAAALSACSKSEQASGPTTCCDQPKIPAGVPAFTVVRDEVTGPSDGQDVKIHVALKQKTKRDDIYPTLQFLYRYAMTRNTFEPTNFLGGRLRHRRRGPDRRQPAGQDLPGAWREGSEVRQRHQAGVHRGGPARVRLQLEPRDPRGSRRHLPPGREEEGRSGRRQVHAQADDEDRSGQEGGRGHVSVPRVGQGRVRQDPHLQQRDDLLGRVRDADVQQGAGARRAHVQRPLERRAGPQDHRPPASSSIRSCRRCRRRSRPTPRSPSPSSGCTRPTTRARSRIRNSRRRAPTRRRCRSSPRTR